APERKGWPAERRARVQAVTRRERMQVMGGKSCQPGEEGRSGQGACRPGRKTTQRHETSQHLHMSIQCTRAMGGIAKGKRREAGKGNEEWGGTIECGPSREGSTAGPRLARFAALSNGWPGIIGRSTFRQSRA